MARQREEFADQEGIAVEVSSGDAGGKDGDELVIYTEGVILYVTGDLDAFVQRIHDAVRLQGWDGARGGGGEIARSAPWAICEGGLIQDSSDDVESIDLDWMEADGPRDLEEVERSWRLLNRVVKHEGRAEGWGKYLHEVEEWLTSMYKDSGTDEEQKVWNEVAR